MQVSQDIVLCVFSFFTECLSVFIWKYMKTSKSIWEYTETSKSVQRAALAQSDLNTAGLTPVLIEWHMIKLCKDRRLTNQILSFCMAIHTYHILTPRD